MIFTPLPVANYAQILAAEAVAAKMRPYAPVRFDSGRETWFEGSAAVVCLDGGAWGRVWDHHIQNESIGNVGSIGNLNPPPAVDFDKNLVLALFNGPTAGVVGYRVQSGYTLGRQGFLHVVPVIDPSTTNAVALPSPWAFLVLPRTKATVSVQVPRNGAWATVAQIPPSL